MSEFEIIKKRILAQVPIGKDFVEESINELRELTIKEILDKIYKTSFIEHLTKEQQEELKECFKLK